MFFGITTEETENLVKGSLVIDCPTMELRSGHATPRMYKGSGSVALKEDGFEVKLYYPHPIDFQEAFESLQWRSGEIISRDSFYSLEAVDLRGRSWTADGILPQKNTGQGGSVIVGTVRLLKTETSLSAGEGYALRALFPDNIQFSQNLYTKIERQIGTVKSLGAMNLDRARFSCENIQFELQREGETIVLSAESDGVVFDDQTASCILTALSFVTASSQQPCLLEKYHSGRLETVVRTNGKTMTKTRTHQPTPIEPWNDAMWRLFDRFLSYGLKNIIHSGHPIAHLVNSVISAGTGALEVEGLLLGVSVESFLRDHFPELQEVDVEENVQIAGKLVSDCPVLDEKFRKRLLGAISAMKAVRPKDCLLNLEKRNLIDPLLRAAWERLRNKSAHGVTIEPAELQRYWNDCETVLVLFYQLVFLRIGYAGPQRDYGTYNWPVKNFDRVLPPSIAAKPEVD
jgi:hypothetical protein